MLQPLLFPVKTLSVSEITRYLRALFESDEILSDVWVQGEVSNLSRPSSGHIYFTLKDAFSSIKCVIWKQTAWRLPLTLQNGMAVEAHGGVDIYERDGQYQLYVDALRLTGEGALYQEFLRLKTRLEAEGLFALERKRPLPEQPSAIGLVTSSSGAALQDILNTLKRRFPLVQVILAPCAVQGEDAPPQIVKSLAALNAQNQTDVIIVARGGGSLEDLWAFNDEGVVRAITDSQIPVITGIGHETDFTLADFAADVRAATPTAAAEQVVPDAAEIKVKLSDMANLLSATIRQICGAQRGRVQDSARRLELQSPLWRVRNDRQHIDELQARIANNQAHRLELMRSNLVHLQKRLVNLSPQAVLQRGYAIIKTAEGVLVKSVRQVHRGDVLDIRVADGAILSKVLTEPTTERNGGIADG